MNLYLLSPEDTGDLGPLLLDKLVNGRKDLGDGTGIAADEDALSAKAYLFNTDLELVGREEDIGEEGFGDSISESELD